MAKKTNRELNQEHDLRQQGRVRPKPQNLEFRALERVVNSWIRERIQSEQVSG